MATHGSCTCIPRTSARAHFPLTASWVRSPPSRCARSTGTPTRARAPARAPSTRQNADRRFLRAAVSPGARLSRRFLPVRRPQSGRTMPPEPQQETFVSHPAQVAGHPPRHTNRLAQETSPYLQQHKHNPVDWYPWGPEAFEAARRQDKPIFLSVGYSTCYWCHVMERQSFEKETVAKEMSERFVNIKVDREERPDVDQLYMTAVQVLTRHGGWPMSVWLTPDLRPFYGGTYFPPEDNHGRPGFVTVLRALEDAYKNRKSDVEQTATQITSILQQLAEPAPPDAPVSIDDHF